MTGLLLTGTVLLFPLFPLTMLFAKKEKEVLTDMKRMFSVHLLTFYQVTCKIEKYLESINPKFKEQNVEFVFVTPYVFFFLFFFVLFNFILLQISK